MREGNLLARRGLQFSMPCKLSELRRGAICRVRIPHLREWHDEVAIFNYHGSSTYWFTLPAPKKVSSEQVWDDFWLDPKQCEEWVTIVGQAEGIE